MPTEHADLLRSNAELLESLVTREEEIAADERAATIFGSVEELYRAYDGSESGEVNVATLRQVNWGLRTVEALIDDVTPPALFKIQEPDRWAYVKTLIAAGSFGLLVALILYEVMTRT